MWVTRIATESLCAASYDLDLYPQPFNLCTADQQGSENILAAGTNISSQAGAFQQSVKLSFLIWGTAPSSMVATSQALAEAS